MASLEFANSKGFWRFGPASTVCVYVVDLPCLNSRDLYILYRTAAAASKSRDHWTLCYCEFATETRQLQIPDCMHKTVWNSTRRRTTQTLLKCPTKRVKFEPINLLKNIYIYWMDDEFLQLLFQTFSDIYSHHFLAIFYDFKKKMFFMT